jgi:hypothetical protein
MLPTRCDLAAPASRSQETLSPTTRLSVAALASPRGPVLPTESDGFRNTRTHTHVAEVG